MRASAYHESGHAVAAWLQGLSVKSASILAEGCSGGQVTHANPLRHLRLHNRISPGSRARIEKVIRVCLAGPIAQRRFRPRTWRHYHGAADHRMAADLITHMTGSIREADAYINLLAVQTEEMLTERSTWRAVKSVAHHLLEEGELSHRRLEDVLRASLARLPSLRHGRRRRCARGVTLDLQGGRSEQSGG